MPDLENPLENYLWAWCILNSYVCISLIVHPPFGIPESAPASNRHTTVCIIIYIDVIYNRCTYHSLDLLNNQVIKDLYWLYWQKLPQNVVLREIWVSSKYFTVIIIIYQDER